jgi:hypothetical protein
MHPNPARRDDELDALFTRRAETRAEEPYRLAGGASGTGRSKRSTPTSEDALDPVAMLAEAAALLEPEPDVDWSSAESLDAHALHYAKQCDEAVTLADVAFAYDDLVRRGAVERRRVLRRAEAIRNRQRRALKRDYATEPRRANHPVKVEVDPAAWNAVKRGAFFDRRPMGAKVAELVDRAVQDRVIPRRSPVRTPERRFARLFVDPETWAAFRALALDAQLSAGRLVGLLVEREARRFEEDEQ